MMKRTETEGGQSSEFGVTRIIVLVGLLLGAVGGFLVTQPSDTMQIVGGVLLTVGPVISGWAGTTYAKGRAEVKAAENQTNQ
jgi:hypothetical protein